MSVSTACVYLSRGSNLQVSLTRYFFPGPYMNGHGQQLPKSLLFPCLCTDQSRTKELLLFSDVIGNSGQAFLNEEMSSLFSALIHFFFSYCNLKKAHLFVLLITSVDTALSCFILQLFTVKLYVLTNNSVFR